MSHDIFKGTTTSIATSGRASGESTLDRLVVSNLGGGVISVNVRVVGGEREMHIIPPYTQLWAGAVYKDEKIFLRDREQVEVSVLGGEIDFYFSITSNK